MNTASRRARVAPVQLAAEARPAAGIGHNGGPPLDNSGSMFLWRRAVKKAWKTPPREIALRRLADAEQLGLSYRDYAAVLKDRGQRLRAAVLVVDAPADLLPTPTRNRIARLDTIPLCIAVRLPRLHGASWRPDDARLTELLAIDGERLQAGWIRRTGDAHFRDVPTLDHRIATLLSRFDLPPGAVFMVGTAAADHAAAQRAGLALYKPWDGYLRG
jgi:hypothetical protein